MRASFLPEIAKMHFGFEFWLTVGLFLFLFLFLFLAGIGWLPVANTAHG
jgi:hypothetical protein